MSGICDAGGYETPYMRDLETYQKIKYYDKRGTLFHRGLLSESRHHFTVYAKGASLEEVLRDLEKKANLPKNDLYISNLKNPEKTHSFLYDEINQYYINSKKAENGWTRDINEYLTNKGKIVLGYILGNVYEIGDKERNINKFGQSTKVVGTLSISENCPGVFADNEKGESRCIYCGETSTASKNRIWWYQASGYEL